jgi:hypothetical protein
MRTGIHPALTKNILRVPNPILHEIRGFPYTHIYKAFFSVIENPFFLDDFCPLGDFFAAFHAARDYNKSPGFILLALTGENL